MFLLKKTPIFIILLICTAFLMFLPAIFGLIIEDFVAARSFFYFGLLILLVSIFLAFASFNRALSSPIRSQLLVAITSFFILPVFFTVPLLNLVPNIDVHTLYFEMVSAFTTTGLTGFHTIEDITDTVLFWQVLVAWFGGLFIWTLYLAIFASLGVNKILMVNENHLQSDFHRIEKKQIHHTEVFLTSFSSIFIPYTIMTLILWFILRVSGDNTFVALTHSMSTMSTSGISPIGGISVENNGYGLLAIFLFLFFAITSKSLRVFKFSGLKQGVFENIEIVTAIKLLLISSLVLSGVYFQLSDSYYKVFNTFLEKMFICMSFLTTTGWYLYPNDQTPESSLTFILIGLVVIGGGVGTTAGGLKLLRFAIMQRHLYSELGRMVHPSQIRISASRMKLNNSIILKVWVLFAMFVLAIILSFCFLTLLGLTLQNAILLSISALSNTGPLYIVINQPIDLYDTLTTSIKYVLLLTMVLGRIEILALFTLFNVELWRK